MSQKPERQFRPNLLNDTIEAKMQYFMAAIIAHPIIDTAQKELLSALSVAKPDSLIFGFGPAGVGKTTLLISVKNKITDRLRPTLESDRERIPAPSAELPAPGPRQYDWRETFRLLLQELQEPLIDRKRASQADDDSDPNRISGNTMSSFRATNRNPTLNDYRSSYITSLRHRRPVAVLLDDAHYLSKVSGSDLLSQLDLVKSLASRSGTPHALFGTYELLALRNLSGQISRRSFDIHLPRYSTGSDDQDSFASAVACLCLKMPVPECPTLEEDSDYLYERSGGCVGVLKDWMGKALYDAISENSATVTLDHMKRRAHSDAALTQMLTEIVEGEKRLEQGGSRYLEIRNEFLRPQKGDCKSPPLVKEKSQGSPKPVSKRKVGERSPARDPIGKRSRAHAR